MHQSARHWLAQSLWVPHSLQAVLSSLCKMPTCVGKMEAYRKSPLYFGLQEMRKGSGPERAVPGAVCCCVCKIYTGCLLLQNGHAHIHTEILLVACCVCKSKIAQTNLCRHLNLLNSNIRFSFVAMDTHHWCKKPPAQWLTCTTVSPVIPLDLAPNAKKDSYMGNFTTHGISNVSDRCYNSFFCGIFTLKRQWM